MLLNSWNYHNHHDNHHYPHNHRHNHHHNERQHHQGQRASTSPRSRHSHSPSSNHAKQQHSLDDLMSLMEARKAYAAGILDRCGYDLAHQFGQRIMTNRKFNEDYINSVVDSEIFIGKLPRDLFEDELFPFLDQVGGTVLKIRYMMDFSGFNRGFCFVKYSSTLEAIKATKLLDGLLLRPDSVAPIGVKMSFDNKCLYFGNLPPTCTPEQLVAALRKAEIGGIVHARMASEPHSTTRFDLPQKQSLFPGLKNMVPRVPHSFGRSRQSRAPSPSLGCYGYVYFESHDAATKARRLLMPSEVKIMGRKITLDWAKSEIPAHVAKLMESSPPINRNMMLEQQFHQLESFKQRTQAMVNENSFFSNWDPTALCH